MLIINIFISLLFLVVAVISYCKSLIAFCFFGILFLICLLNTFVLIYNQGIIVDKKKILIVDYFYFTKLNLSDLKRVELKEIKKEKSIEKVNKVLNKLENFINKINFLIQK